MKKLPEKMSDLIDVALEDLAKVEASEKYIVEMGTWHEPGEPMEACEVCFAGGVMAMSLNADPEDLLSPDDFKLDIANKLSALNELRMGDTQCAALELGIDHGEFPFRNITHYSDDPAGFVADTKQLAVDLREAGL
jgi:hypothetical protein